MSSSIIRKDLPFTRNERHHELGIQGEINVGKLLGDYFGVRNISYAMDGYSEGTNGYPDLILKLNPPLAIEIKSMSTFVHRTRGDKTAKYINYVPIVKDSWYNELAFAKSKKMKLILIVEIRLKDKGIYFWFDHEMLKPYLEKSDAQYAYVSIHDVMNKGNSLIYPDEIKYLEYWNYNTPLEDDKQNTLAV